MSNNSGETQSSEHISGRDSSLLESQPESGFVDDCKEHIDIRQSSPTNPRVNDKSEINQEEA